MCLVTRGAMIGTDKAKLDRIPTVLNPTATTTYELEVDAAGDAEWVIATASTGPQGPVGPQGPAGPAGADGADGTMVIANPDVTTGVELNFVTIGDIDYEITGSGGGTTTFGTFNTSTTNIAVEFNTGGEDVTASVQAPTFVLESSVSNRTTIISADRSNNDTHFSDFSIEGDDNLTVSFDLTSRVIDLTTSSISPVSHDPYSITIGLEGAAVQDPVDDRLFSVPEGSAGEVLFTVAATPFETGVDTERYTVNSISNVGPFTVASLSGSVTNRVVVNLASNQDVGTYNVHFRVNYTVTEVDTSGDPIEGTTTHHHKDENYTVVVEADFYAGIIANSVGIPTLLSQFASGDNRGVIANGKSVTVTNTLSPAVTGTLFLAIPEDSYNANSFEITTNGYPLAIDARTVVAEHQIIEVGTFEPTEDLTFVIQGVV